MYFNRNKKICHIVSTDITVKFLLMPQLKFLINEGYDAYVVCSPGKWIKDIEAEGIKVKTIEITRRISLISDLISLFKLFFYFRKEKFDIVHTHAPKPGLLGQLAAKMAGVPVIINTVHGLYFTKDSSNFKRNFFVFFEKIAAKCSDLIFSQNKEDIDTIIKERIAKLGKIKYLGNGIDTKKFNAENFSESFILQKKKELNLHPDIKIIGMVGRLVKEKGYLDLFEAFKVVLEKYPKVILLVIGPKEPLKKDKFNPNIVKHYGIENKVIFLGERIDIDQLYPLMDIFVLPSHREGFPRSVLEAMAEERPIIATDIRGCREEIENNKSGILIPTKNPKKLAEAILFLLQNPDKAKELAQHAKVKAQKEFDENIVFAKIKVSYERLLKDKIGLHRFEESPYLKPIKICHVATVDITIRFIVWDFLTFLKKANYNISIVCSPGKWTPFLKEGGFLVHTVTMTRKITPLEDLVSLVKLFLYFKKEKFDVVHTYTPKAGVLGRIAARMAGVPVVVHSSFGFYIGLKISPWTRGIILFAEKIASYFCDVIFSQNKEDIEMVVSKNIIHPKKLELSTFGIDIKRFNTLSFDKDFINKKKKELHIKENKKVIGMVGRFVKEKGYLDLFEAFKIIKNKNYNVVLLLVAPQDKVKEDSLDYAIFKEYGILNEVILLGDKGEISNVEEIYSLMDIFVLPSYREGFSQSIMEASAFSKPVVATNIRGCREAVEDGVTGILVPPENPEKLAEVLMYLLDNPEIMEKMGSNGRKKAEVEFNENLFFDKMNKQYHRLLKEKNK